jgi:hypothetical protein
MSGLGILCHTFAAISATILYSLYTIRLLVEVHIRDFGNVYSDHSAEESSRINLDPWRTIIVLPISLRIFFSFLVTFFWNALNLEDEHY